MIASGRGPFEDAQSQCGTVGMPDLTHRVEWDLVLCPKCKKDSAHRSHRRGFVEYVVGVAGFYPYRCQDCQLRFLHFRYASIAQAATGVEREIRATRGAIKAKRKRRELLLYAAAVVLFLAFLYYITRERGGSSDVGSAAPAPSHILSHFALTVS